MCGTDRPVHVYETQEELEAARVLLRRQLTRVRKADGQTFCAACDRMFPVLKLYRCYFCGLYFCEGCGSKHFGPRPVAVVKGWEDERRS